MRRRTGTDDRLADWKRAREEVLQRVDAAMLGQWIENVSGPGRNRQYRCPTPTHDDQNPSCSVSDRSGRATWKCWSCNAQGDAFELLKVTLGLDYKEALKEACDRTGVEYPGDKQVTKYVSNASTDTYFDEIVEWESNEIYLSEEQFHDVVNEPLVNALDDSFIEVPNQPIADNSVDALIGETDKPKHGGSDQETDSSSDAERGGQHRRSKQSQMNASNKPKQSGKNNSRRRSKQSWGSLINDNGYHGTKSNFPSYRRMPRLTAPDTNRWLNEMEDNRREEDGQGKMVEAWAAQRGWDLNVLTKLKVHEAERVTWRNGQPVSLTVVRHPVWDAHGNLGGWQDRAQRTDRQRYDLPKWWSAKGMGTADSCPKCAEKSREAQRRCVEHGGVVANFYGQAIGTHHGLEDHEVIGRMADWVDCVFVEGMSDWVTAVSSSVAAKVDPGNVLIVGPLSASLVSSVSALLFQEKLMASLVALPDMDKAGEAARASSSLRTTASREAQSRFYDAGDLSDWYTKQSKSYGHEIAGTRTWEKLMSLKGSSSVANVRERSLPSGVKKQQLKEPRKVVRLKSAQTVRDQPTSQERKGNNVVQLRSRKSS